MDYLMIIRRVEMYINSIHIFQIVILILHILIQ